MPKLPWFTVQEGIKRLGEIGMLEWVYHLRLIHPHWESEDLLFPNLLRNKFVRGVQASLKSSVSIVPSRPELTVRTVATQLEKLNALEIIGFRGDGHSK